MTSAIMGQLTFDVVIIGAGISGINVAYRLQESLPNASYAILDARSEIGGTWSLFKYPGIRSDSDLHTFGFGWDPWKEERAIADAPSILNYLKSTAAKHGIDRHIVYNHKVLRADWSSKAQKWTTEALVNETEKRNIVSSFIILGTGYYDYTQGLNGHIPGLDTFKGTVVHPQFWPEDLDYSNKKLVVIGSGATAATLVPALTDKAAHVTMLQRSPSYFVSLPLKDKVGAFTRKILPERWAFKVARIRFMVFSYFLFFYCRLFPQRARMFLRKETEKQLPPNVPHDPHFNPVYNPWQQRMCLTPGGDFFQALGTGKADIVTDAIETVTDTGIKLRSGQELDTDIIVTATGLKMLFAGGLKFYVDGKEHFVKDKHVWRGALIQDLPNLGFIFGYTNASWTLGADAASQLIVRLLKNLRKQGLTSVVPRIENPGSVKDLPWLNLNSTYIKAAVENQSLPKGGDIGPWKPRSIYLMDYIQAKWGDITTGLQYNGVALR